MAIDERASIDVGDDSTGLFDDQRARGIVPRGKRQFEEQLCTPGRD